MLLWTFSKIVHDQNLKVSYLEWFLKRKVHCALAFLSCIVHIFTDFKACSTGLGFGVVHLKRQQSVGCQLLAIHSCLLNSKANPGPFLSLSLPVLLHTRAFGLFLSLPLLHSYIVCVYFHLYPKTTEQESAIFTNRDTHLYFLCALYREKQPYSQQHTYQSRKVEERQHSVGCQHGRPRR